MPSLRQHPQRETELTTPLPPILAIRDAIWPLHARLEAIPPMSSLGSGLATLEEYTLALKMLYGFLAPLERGLFTYERRLNKDNDLALYIRAGSWSRLNLLVNDLHGIGLNKNDMSRLFVCRNLPEITLPEAALGHLYVLEGSRLGGKVIASKVKQRLGLDESCGCSYFSSNGMEVSGHWRDFKKLTESLSRPESLAITAEAARDCFLALEGWMKEWPN